MAYGNGSNEYRMPENNYRGSTGRTYEAYRGNEFSGSYGEPNRSGRRLPSLRRRAQLAERRTAAARRPSLTAIAGDTPVGVVVAAAGRLPKKATRVVAVIGVAAVGTEEAGTPAATPADITTRATGNMCTGARCGYCAHTASFLFVPSLVSSSRSAPLSACSCAPCVPACPS